MREFFGHSIRAARLVARDQRIPKPLRSLAALALLPIPGPFDEAVFVIVAVALFVFYRGPMREAWRAGAAAAAPRDLALQVPPVGFEPTTTTD